MPDDNLSERDWITTQEAAEIGGYTDASGIRAAAIRGVFRAEKSEAGDVWLIYKPDFLRWLKEKTHGLRGDEG